VPLALQRLGLLHGWNGGGIEIGHEAPQLGRAEPRTPREAVIVAFAIDNNPIPSVAAGEYIFTRLLERRAKTHAVVGALADRLDFRLHRHGIDAGIGATERFPFFRTPVGPVEVAVRHQDTFAAFEVEGDFELARGAFVDAGGEGIRNRHPYQANINPRADEVLTPAQTGASGIETTIPDAAAANANAAEKAAPARARRLCPAAG